MQNISPAELKRRLDSDAPLPLLLDVREPWEVERACLPHSHCIPMGELAARLQELDPDRETVVLCHHGIRSRSVGLFLEQHMQFSNVLNLDGGIDAWARQVDPAVPTY